MTKPAKTPAIDRLKSDAPDGPPFLVLILDEPTVRRLAEGVVNARAEVAARQSIASLDVGSASVRDRSKRTA